MGFSPVWCNLKQKSIDVVHKKLYEWKDKGRVKKEGPTSFFPTPFFPSLTFLLFVLFSYGQRQCFWVAVAPNWAKTHPRWQPRTTLYASALFTSLGSFQNQAGVFNTNTEHLRKCENVGYIINCSGND
jgi:hypothetical protein